MGLVKSIAGMLGWMRALPILIGFHLSRGILGRNRALTAASERIARVPGFLGIYARQAFYRRTLSHVGRDAYLGFMSVFSKSEATLGDRVYIGRFCTIGWALIGDDVMLADGVQVLSGQHQHGHASEGRPLRDNPQEFRPVKIGAGAWVGAGAVVMADVGERAVVGAGAVIVRPVPAGERVGGVPAKSLGH